MTPQEFFEQLTKLNIEFSGQQLTAVQAVQGPGTAFSCTRKRKNNGACIATGLYDTLLRDTAGKDIDTDLYSCGNKGYGKALCVVFWRGRS